MRIQPMHLVMFLAGVAMGAAFLMSCGGSTANAHTDFSTRYAVQRNLNTGSIDVATSFVPIGPILAFDKVSDTTQIELQLHSLVSVISYVGASTVQFELRVDGATSPIRADGRIVNTDNSAFVSAFAAFEGLSAGSHEAQIYARTNNGAAQGVGFDSGGFDGGLIVREVP